MKKSFVALCLFGMFVLAGTALAADQPIFGPVKYEVKERFGKDNRYTATVKTAEGLYLIKLQNGEKPAERSDYIEFSVNGEQLLKNDKYDYLFIAGFVQLHKENTFELNIKDEVPTGFKRPTPTPKNVTITIMPAPVKLGKVLLGLNSWSFLNDITGSLLKIKDPSVASLAVQVASLQTEVSKRTEGMKQLAERKDEDVKEFFGQFYNDISEKSEVRGEAAIGLGLLGDKKYVPALMLGVLDSEELVRKGSALALSYYKEEDTKDEITKLLMRLDFIRRDAVVRSIVSAGWRPVGTLLGMVDDKDVGVEDMAVELLGGSKDPRVGDLLLKLLKDPGKRNINLIITALGECKETRAVEIFHQMAKDPAQRRKKEAVLGHALARIGDPRSVEVIVGMINRAERRSVRDELMDAYKKLTGKDYKVD